MRLTWQQSQDVLKLLASVSSQQHRIQVLRRNTEAKTLEQGSKVGCPHCQYNENKQKHQCRNCLWTYAIRKVTGEKVSNNHRQLCPCMDVQFVFNQNGYELDYITIATDELILNELEVDTISKDWIDAHIKWSSNPEEWNTQPPPKGYRTKINF